MKSAWKRSLALLLALIMSVSALPMEAFAAEAQAASLDVSAGMHSSFVRINPLYADVISEDDLPEPANDGIAAVAVEEYCATTSEAADQLREAMKARATAVEIGLISEEAITEENFNTIANGLFDEVFSEAMAHTGEATEGDYLKFQYGGLSGEMQATVDSNGVSCITYILTVAYYTTAAQEKAMDSAVNSLLSQLNLSGAGNYEKIKGIYDYICTNVEYDYANLEDEDYLLKYTGYAALINKTAVCQGYAVLFYRLMLELGVDARVISGDGGGPHAWNIVELDGKYYNVDSTWDAGVSSYSYFLRCPSNFAGHTRDAQYDTAAFHAAYPMSSVDYGSSEGGGDGGEDGGEEEEEPTFEGASGTCDNGFTWVITPEGVLTVTGEGAMEDYGVQTSPWYQYRDYIKEIVIADTITYLGRYAFAYLPKVTKITIPAGVTTVGDNAMHDCAGLLTAGPIGSGSNIEFGWTTAIPDYAFYMVTHLQAVTVPDTVTSIGVGAFGYTSLIDLTIPKGVTVIPKDMCVNILELLTVSLPEGITEIGDNAFSACCILKEINIPSTVTSIGEGAFFTCEDLTEINLPEGLTALGMNAFGACKGLKSVTVPSTLKALPSSAFGSCASITELVLKEGLETIGNYAFMGCDALAEVTIPSTVTSIGITAFSCKSLAKITFAGSVPTFGNNPFLDVTANAYYPACNATWTADVMQNYGGTLTWKAACTSHVAGEAVKENEVASTCTQQGHYDLATYCTVCEEELSRQTVTQPLIEHVAGEGVKENETASTCTVQGSYDSVTYCTACGKELSRQTVTQPLIEHVAGEGVKENETASTCTVQGSYDSVIYCTVCNAELGRETVMLPLADHIAGEAVKENVTGESHELATYCTVCGEELSRETVAYDAPRLTAVETLTENDYGALYTYVSVSWEEIEGSENYEILRKIPGGEWESVGYSAESPFQDLSAELYTDYVYTVRCVDSGCQPTSGYDGEGLTHFYPSGNCGEAAQWKLTADHQLTISGTGAMDYGWNMEQAPWYALRAEVKNAVTEAGVTSIASYAFQGCTALESVTIADTVDSIGQCAFFDCNALKEVIVPEGVTEIPYRTFYLCTSLKRVEISSTVFTIGNGAFDGCAALSDVQLPEGLTSLGKSAFTGCDSLTAVVLPDGITELAMNTFSGCSNLAEITFPKGLVVLGAYALSNCSALTELNLPESLTTIGTGAIRNCSSLESLTIPKTVTSIGTDAFEGCVGLKKVCFSSNMPSGSNWFGETDCTVYYPQSNTSWTSACMNAAGSHINWIAWYPTSGTSWQMGTPVLTGAENTVDGVKVTWAAVDGAESYAVYRKGGTVSSWKQIATVTGTSYADTGVVSGTSYCYTVRVLSGGKTVSAYDAGGVTVYCLDTPSVTLANHANGVKLSWNQIAGADGYQIYRKTADTGWIQVASISESSTVSYVDASVKGTSGTTYYYGVQAVKGSDVSSYVTNRKGVYLAQPEVTLTMGSSGVYVNWKEVAGAQEYRIYRKTANTSWTPLTTVTDGTTFRYADTAIRNNSGTTYYYTVRAYAGSAQSSYDGTKTIKFLLQPSPALSNTATGVKVSWNKINGASGYYIYRKTASAAWEKIATVSSSATGYTDKTALSGTTYYYGVRAYSGSVLSTYKTTCSIHYLAQPSVTLAMGSIGVYVNWKKVEGAEGYRVYRKTSSTGWTLLTTVTDGTTFRYADTSIGNNSGTAYYYTVRAYKGSAQSSYDSTKTIKFLLQPTPAVSNVSTGVMVSWNKITGAAGYYVYRKTSSTSWAKIATIKSSSTVSYTDTAVKSSNGSQYIYTVRAYSGSTMSTYHSGKTILRLTAPNFSSLTNVSTKSMLAKWTSNSKADGYQIQYSTSSGFSGAKTVTVKSNSTLSKTISGLTKGKRYYVRIRCYDIQGSTTYYSAWSNSRNVKVSK